MLNIVGLVSSGDYISSQTFNNIKYFEKMVNNNFYSRYLYGKKLNVDHCVFIFQICGIIVLVIMLKRA